MNPHLVTPNRSVGKTILAAFLSLAALALLPAQLSATVYYCSGSGSDSNSGLSTTAAFRTLQIAQNKTLPGDTVNVMNGTYSDDPLNGGEGPLVISRSGQPGAYITWQAYPGHTPVIHSTQWNSILITGSYIVVNGLTCQGNNANITMSQADAVYTYYLRNQRKPSIDWAYISTTNTNGIFIRADKTTNANPHHITIQNCLVYMCAGGGICSVGGDYLTFKNNIAHSNCWYGIYAGSGFSFNAPKAFDTAPGYHMIMDGNIAYDNECYEKWYSTKAISDGNGIIYDSSNTNSYTGAAIFSNNISYENGGSGMHGFASSNLTLVNNTLYNNVRSPALSTWPQFGMNQCTNSSARNNIVYGRTGRTAAPWTSTGCVMDYNMYWNTPALTGLNNITANPMFASLTVGSYDFHLQTGSLGIDSGTSTSAPSTDYSGAARPQGAGYDRGAYER